MEQTKQKNSKYIFLAFTLLFLFVYLVINIPHISIIADEFHEVLINIFFRSLNKILNLNIIANILLFIFSCLFKILINFTSYFILTIAIIFYSIYIFKALDKKLFKILSFVFILLFCFINIVNLFRSSFGNIISNLTRFYIIDYRYAFLQLSVTIISRLFNYILVGLNFVAIISVGFSILFCILGCKVKLPIKIIFVILLCLLLIDSFNTYCLEYGFTTLISSITIFIMHSNILYKIYYFTLAYSQIFMICSHSVYLIVITVLFIVSLIWLIKNKAVISKSVLITFIILFVVFLWLWSVYLCTSYFGFISFYENIIKYFIIRLF